MSTTEERFQGAVVAARECGVHLKLNVMTCCRSCVMPEDLDLSDEDFENEPNAFHFGGQGNELVWCDGNPFFRDEQYDDAKDDEDDDRSFVKARDARPAEVVYFYHRGPGLTAAQILTEIFRGEGFMVDWDGTEDNAVQVHVG